MKLENNGSIRRSWATKAIPAYIPDESDVEEIPGTKIRSSIPTTPSTESLRNRNYHLQEERDRYKAAMEKLKKESVANKEKWSLEKSLMNETWELEKATIKNEWVSEKEKMEKRMATLAEEREDSAPSPNKKSKMDSAMNIAHLKGRVAYLGQQLEKLKDK